MTHILSHSFSQNPLVLTDAEKLRLLIDATSEKLATIDPRLTVIAPVQWGDLLNDDILQALGNPTESQLNSPIEETGMAQLMQMADEFVQSQPEDARRLIDGFMNFAGDDNKEPKLSKKGWFLVLLLMLGSSFEVSNFDGDVKFRLAFGFSDEVQKTILAVAETLIALPGAVKDMQENNETNDDKSNDE